MIAIQDKTLHAEITAMLNSKKGKEFKEIKTGKIIQELKIIEEGNKYC